MPRKKTKELRKELKNITREALNRKTKEELKALCKKYKIGTSGSTNVLIDRILRAYEQDEKKTNKRKHLSSREEEMHLLKKRKIEVQDVILDKKMIPREIIVHILQFLPINRDLLDGIGMVNQAFYILVRSGDVWNRLHISPSNLYCVPIPILQECKHIVLNGKFAAKDVEYLMGNLKKVIKMDANVESWTIPSIKKLLSNQEINDRLELFGAKNGFYRHQSHEMLNLFFEKITSKNLKVLKLTNLKTNIMKSDCLIKDIVEKYPNLEWLEFSGFGIFPQGEYSLNYLLEKLPNLEGLMIDKCYTESFKKMKTNLKYLEIPGFYHSLSGVNTLIESCPNLKIFAIHNGDFNSIPEIYKLPNLEEIRVNYYNSSSFSEFANLKRLTINEPPAFEKPIHHLEYLKVFIKRKEDVKNLIQTFPTVKVLELIIDIPNSNDLLPLEKMKIQKLVIQHCIELDDSLIEKIAKECKVKYLKVNGKVFDMFKEDVELRPIMEIP